MINDKKDAFETISLPVTSSSVLRGKQSVRATFKISRQSITAMKVVSIHLGIKQKSLFDHLMSDLEGLSNIASEVDPSNIEKENCVQKTYVISRETLDLL